MDKHSLPYSCVADLLKLFAVTVPNFSPCSVHTLLNKFTNFKESTKIHRCCSFCTKLLTSDASCTRHNCVAKALPDSSLIKKKTAARLKSIFYVHYNFHAKDYCDD